MRPSLPAGKSGEGGAVNSGEAKAMPTPNQNVGNGADQETETCLDSFLGVLEYLSGATGLSVEDIADLLASKEGLHRLLWGGPHSTTRNPTNRIFCFSGSFSRKKNGRKKGSGEHTLDQNFLK